MNFFGIKTHIPSDFIRNVLETFGVRMSMIAIGIVTSVIVTRTLGPEGRGFYAIAVMVGALGVQFVNFGLPGANTYFLARNPESLPPILGNSLVISFGFGSCAVISAWIAFSLWPGMAPISGPLLAMALVWIPFGLADMFASKIFLGLHDVRTFNKLEVVKKVLTTGLVLSSIGFGFVNVEAVFAAYLSAQIVCLGYAVLKMRPHLTGWCSPSLAVFNENLVYGLKGHLSTLFAYLVIRVDLLMIKYMLGPEQTGYYSTAVGLADMTYMIPTVIATILFPKLSSLGSYSEKWKFAKTVVIFVAATMTAVALIAILSGRFIIVLLYGQAFIPSVQPFLLLIIGMVFLSVNMVYMNFFASIGRPLVIVYSPAAACVLNIIINVKLIPVLGINGASVASILSYALMLVISLIYMRYSGKSRNETNFV